MKKVALGALQSPPPPSRPTQGLVCPWDSPSALGRALNFGHLNLGAGGVYLYILYRLYLLYLLYFLCLLYRYSQLHPNPPPLFLRGSVTRVN